MIMDCEPSSPGPCRTESSVLEKHRTSSATALNLQSCTLVSASQHGVLQQAVTAGG